MQTYNLYRDTVHGLQAQAAGRIQAFQLIKNACFERKLQAPALEQIELVKEDVPDLRRK